MSIRILCLCLALLLGLLPACTHRAGGERQESLKDWLGSKNGDSARSADEFARQGDQEWLQGSPDLAVVSYGKAIALQPNNMELRHRRARLLLAQDRDQEAAVDYLSILQVAPRNTAALESLGLLSLKNGDPAKARQFLQSALAENPNLWLAQACLGVALAQEKDTAGAIRAYETALRLNPGQKEVLNNLGVAHLAEGQAAPAAQSFHQAIRAGSTSPKTYNNLGLALARLRRYDEALEAFRAASPEAVAYNNLGYIQYLAGDNAQAVRNFERAIAASPSYYAQAGENLKRARMASQSSGVPGPGPAFSAPPPRGAPPLPAPATTGPSTTAPAPVRKPVVEKGLGPEPGVLIPAGERAQASSSSTAGPGVLPAAIKAEDAPLATNGTAAPTATTEPFPAASSTPPAPTPPPATTPTGTTTPSALSAGLALAGPGPKAPATATGPSFFGVMLSSWKSQDKATTEVGKARAPGQSTYVIKADLPTGAWYRVMAGRFASLEQAKAYAGELASRFGLKDLVVLTVHEGMVLAP